MVFGKSLIPDLPQIIFNPISAKRFLRCFILFYDNSGSCGLWPQQIMCSLWLLKIFSWPFGPARYLVLALWASKSLKTLKWINSWRVKCDGDHVQNKFGGLMVNQDILSYLTFNLLDVKYLRLALWASWILLPARVWTISCGLWPIYMKCLSIKYLPEVPSH